MVRALSALRHSMVFAIRQTIPLRHHRVRGRLGRVGGPPQPPRPDVQPLQEVQR